MYTKYFILFIVCIKEIGHVVVAVGRLLSYRLNHVALMGSCVEIVTRSKKVEVHAQHRQAETSLDLKETGSVVAAVQRLRHYRLSRAIHRI